MSEHYEDNHDHELEAAIEEALSALMNVPDVGKCYDQQHKETQEKAYRRLKEALENSDAF